MLVDVVSKRGWGGLGFGLGFIRESLAGRALPMARVSEGAAEGAAPGVLRGAGASPWSRPRPWCVVEASSKSFLYPPGLPREFRRAVSEGRLFWVRTLEEGAPAIVQMMLESGLCEGVLVRGLEKFSRVCPAAVWARRWQLAARKGGAHLFWMHEGRHAVIGFDVRLEWTGPGVFEIKKGHGYFENGGRLAIAAPGVAAAETGGGENGTDRPAA